MRNALVVATMLVGVLTLATLAGCSREKIDWKSAEAADSVEAYDHFLERHPEGELATQARARVAQLNEDRDWKRATATDTADGYRQFLSRHESGKWAEEARIRVENFSLDGTAAGPAKPSSDPEPAVAGAPAATPAATHGPKEAQSPPTNPVVAAKPASEPKAVATAKPAVAATDEHLAAAKPGSAVKPTATATPAAHAGVPETGATPTQFGIQLGAFRSQDAALTNWKQLQVKFDSDLHGLFARAVPVQQSGGQLFRLQAPVGEETRARAICASLTKRSQPCVVVLPRTPR